jgi:RNA-binding protein NOB1
MEDSPTSTAPSWSNILKSQAVPKPNQQEPAQAIQVFVDSCKSTKGIAVAVVDANAIIDGGDGLSRCADRFVTVPEVLAEVRDPLSRHRLSVLPFSLHSMDPSPDSLNKGTLFSFILFEFFFL